MSKAKKDEALEQEEQYVEPMPQDDEPMQDNITPDAPAVPEEMMAGDVAFLGDEDLPEDDDLPADTPPSEEAAQGDTFSTQQTDSELAPSADPEQPADAAKEESAAMQAARAFTAGRRGRRAAPRTQPAEGALNARPRSANPIQRPNANEFLSTESFVKSAQKSRSLLTGTVIETNYDEDGTPCAIVMLNDIPVWIPYKEFFPRRTPNDDPRRQRAALDVCVGAKIDFIITGYKRLSTAANRGHFLGRATGSRAPAMQFFQDQYFGPNARNKVEVGTVLEGTVLSIHRSRFSLTATICGVDRNITLGELSASYAETVDDLGYKVGSPITVKVRNDLARDENGKVTRISFSAREYEAEQNLARIQDMMALGVLTQGARMIGTVRYIGQDEAGTPVYYVALDAFPATQVRATRQYIHTNALAALPTRGSKVRVQVANVVPDRGILNGMIVEVVKQSATL